MSKPLHVLIVEDSADDMEFTLRELRRYGFDPIHERVDTNEETVRALGHTKWDVVLSDYSMPGFTGLDALKLVRQRDADLPFILISGEIGEETAVLAMKAGAQDYLMKSNLARLAPVIERELREAEMRRERKKTAAILQAIVEFSGDPIISKSLDGIITSWNQAAEVLFGYSAEEMIGQSILKIIPPERIKEEDLILSRLSAGVPIEHYETIRLKRNGQRVPVSLTISPLRDASGKIFGASKIVRDITERKEAEAKLAEWQRELEHRVAERTAELTKTHKELEVVIEERRRLETEIARVSEREQLRLGQELHDGLGQQLTGISYLLAVLQEKLGKNSEQAKEAGRVQALIQQSVTQTKNLAKGFYPVDLERMGFLVALQEIAHNTSVTSKASCVVESDENPIYSNLKGPHTIQLFRIAQEAVHNVLKHTAAKHIVIGLTSADGRILLSVKDDGAGFPFNVRESKGMGLRIMQYRAETIGGKLRTENDPNGGAVVTCSVAIDDLQPPPVPATEKIHVKSRRSEANRKSGSKASTRT